MNVGAMGTAINSASSAIAKIGANQALAKISKVMPEWMKDKPDWLTEDNVDDYFDTTGANNNHHLFRDPDAISNPSSDYELEYGLYDYNLDRPMNPYQGLPSPTYQTEFEDGAEGDFEAGGFFSDYFEGPQADFQGSPEDSRKDHVTRTGGPFEQDGGPFEQGGGPFEQDGGPFERAEVSSGGVFEEGGPFEDWRHEGEDGNSVESRKTTAAPSSSQLPRIHATMVSVKILLNQLQSRTETMANTALALSTPSTPMNHSTSTSDSGLTTDGA